MSRDRFTARMEKRRAVNNAEAAGLIADGLAFRGALVERMARGEITHEEAMLELKRVKREAKRNGLVTRQQAWSRG